MGKTIGIDLGTTNSCVSVMEGDKATIIGNVEGGRTTPSVVAFTKDGERLVGETARRQAAVNVERTIFSIKREYSPQEISSMILMKLKKDAENYLGEPVYDAVITVPAYFNDAGRQAAKDAGRIAGLTVKRIINEPTAAALAYGLDHGQEQKVLVYDLGGGTFDVSVIEIGDNLIEVLATAGDNHLGGDDFNERLTNYILKEFKKQEKVKLEKDIGALQRVKEAAESAKKALSSSESYTINLPYIGTKRGEPVHLEMNITRDIFQSLTKDLVDRTEIPVKNALSDAGLTPKDIDKVLLVGGSTRMPAVERKIQSLLGKEPSKKLNPDECVALGAAIQGGKLNYEMITSNAASDIVLMDVTPLSLSIETIGGVANVLIERNTTIPTRHSKIFTTAGNFQKSVDIKVYQGERKFVRDNKLLGNFRLDGIKRAPAGVPQIEVAFDIDVNGIVKVSAKDLSSGKEQMITITSSSNLSEEEIERAKQDAQMYAHKDDLKKELIDIRNDGEAYCYEVEKILDSRKDTMDKKDRKLIKSDLNYLKKLVAKAKPEKITEIQAGEIKEARAKLEQTLNSILD